MGLLRRERGLVLALGSMIKAGSGSLEIEADRWSRVT